MRFFALVRSYRWMDSTIVIDLSPGTQVGGRWNEYWRAGWRYGSADAVMAGARDGRTALHSGKWDLPAPAVNFIVDNSPGDR
jgi:hypothetical protein